jgi:putative ABC transport system ATP-binding protein
MIELQNIYKTYDSAAGKVQALKNINLQIDEGENVIIIGKSGSGKSTLLHIISGIDRPEEGEVVISGINLNELSESNLSLWRGRNIGIVFQFYQLISTLSAIDNIIFAMDLVGKIPKKQRRARAEFLLSKVLLLEKKKKFVNELSGGEKQRVAIARALANDPPILIADEPTGNLDSQTGAQIHAVFKMLNNEGKTIITVTHEHIHPVLTDRVISIRDGELNSLVLQ